MYFETTMHSRRQVTDAAEAAHLIHTGKVRDFDALVWKLADGRELCAVGDNHCNDTWKEVAVIDLTNRHQIESITFGWIDSESKGVEYLKKCETAEIRMRSNVTLPLDGEGDETPANFECGCCGSCFKSTLKQQRVYDQDNGFGICPSCGG